MDFSIVDYPATLILLVLNVGVSVLAFAKRDVFEYLALAPYRMRARHEYHQLVTSGFVHVNGMHLFVNMLTLYFFGPALEQISLVVTGDRTAYLIIYLVSLLVGSLYPFIKYRHNPNYAAAGASGAISGVVFAFCMILPMEKIYVFFAIPLPAFVYAFLYVGYSIWGMRRGGDNIGHEAHLGGAIGGVITVSILMPSAIFFLRSLFGG